MFKQMKYFVTIIDKNSFTLAAETLFISQSAISQQIRLLEESLGVELIKRENRKFSMTPAGDYFYRQCKEMLAQIEDIKEETIRIGQDNELQLRIGYLAGYHGEEFSHTVAEFHKKYPEVYMEIHAANHETLYEWLRDDQIDLVLNDQRRAFSEEYQNLILAEMGSYIEISSTQELSRNSFVTMEQLRRLPCILVAAKDQQSKERDFYQNTLGFGGNFLFADSMETARLMVIAGRGFLPVEGQLLDALKIGGGEIVRIPLCRMERQIYRNYCAFWRKEKTNYYIEEFAKMLKIQFETDQSVWKKNREEKDRAI